MMPVGPIMLSILVILIHFGFLERVLDRMRLTDRQALLITLAMLLGSAVTIPLGPALRMNLGGALIPLAVVAYLLVTADHWAEPVRALGAAVVTSAAVYLVGRWFPPGEPTELNFFFLDAQYIYGLMAGLVGYAAGRSRRAAFCAGVLGVVLADLAHYAGNRWGAGRAVVTDIGGGGFWDTTVVAGVLAVLLAELLGETREALQGGPAGPVGSAAEPGLRRTGGDDHGRP